MDDLSFEDYLSDGDNNSDFEDLSKIISKIPDTGNCKMNMSNKSAR